MAKFQSTKTYGNDRGLSCCFRQWKANHSHCSTLHGYSLGFKFVWESETLDEKNWCFDFGGMKPIKEYLDYMFDHTILVAEDDPALDTFKTLARASTIDDYDGVKPSSVETDQVGNSTIAKPYERGRLCALRIVPGVGCELTAKLVYEKSVELLEKMKSGELGRYAVNPDVRLVSVECFEHGANSAVYYGDVDPVETNPMTMTEDLFFAQAADSIRKVFSVDVGNLSIDKIKACIENFKK
jgi:6-pyruvoyltetrahydropterin/6-carboxytetrahydropterin synthase